MWTSVTTGDPFGGQLLHDDATGEDNAQGCFPGLLSRQGLELPGEPTINTIGEGSKGRPQDIDCA